MCFHTLQMLVRFATMTINVACRCQWSRRAARSAPVMWRAAGVDFTLTQREGRARATRHAASVWTRSRTIMKNPPSAGASADAHESLRRHRALLPRLPETRRADRWLDALGRDAWVWTLKRMVWIFSSVYAWHTDADSCCMRGTRLTGADARRRVAALWLVVHRKNAVRYRERLETPGVASTQQNAPRSCAFTYLNPPVMSERLA